MKSSARSRVASLALLCAVVLPVAVAHAEGQTNAGDAAAEKRETRVWLTRIQDAAIKRIYGHSFSKHSCNNIMDGFMREAYRMKKAFLYLTTPWEK